MKRLFFRRLSSPLLILLIGCFFLFACTSQGDGQAQAATISSISSTALQKCGTLSVLGGRLQDEKTASAKGLCFEQAYLHCKLATLLFTISGVDTVAMNTFTISKRQNHCIITSLVQYHIIPMPLKTRGKYTCTGVSRTKGALLIEQCGTEGTVTIPLSNK